MIISKGLGTYAGLVGALAQYFAAIAVFLEADAQALALGPLATATVTLVSVIQGRMRQATAAIENPKPAASAYVDTDTRNWNPATSGGTTYQAWSTPRPGVEVNAIPEGSIPAPGGQ